MSEIMAGREQLEENLKEEELEQKAALFKRASFSGLAMEEVLFDAAASSSDRSESEDEELQSLGQLCGVQCVHIQ